MDFSIFIIKAQVFYSNEFIHLNTKVLLSNSQIVEYWS